MMFGEQILNTRRRFSLIALSLVLFAFAGISKVNAQYCEFDYKFPQDPPININYFEFDDEAVIPFNYDYYGYIDLTADEGVPALNMFRGTQYSSRIYAGIVSIDGEGSIQQWYYSDVYVYIDWNQDEDFEDSGELVFEYNADTDDEVPNYDFEHIFSVNVPSDAPVGTTKIRIVVDYYQGRELGGDATGPCLSNYGEARDIDVRIVPGNDAGVTAARVGDGTFGPGEQPVRFTITNYADKPLESATIEWSVDGVPQAPYAWTGTLNFGETEEVTVGNYDFQYKRPFGSYSVTGNTDRPNGAPDEVPANDALTTAVQVAPALTPGNYTIGTGQDFPTFTDLTDYLDNGIIGEGDLNFDVHSGTYREALDFTGFTHENNAFRFASRTGSAGDVVIENDGEFVFHLCNPGLSMYFDDMTFHNTAAVAGASTSITTAHVFDISCHPHEVVIEGCDIMNAAITDRTTHDMNFATIWVHDDQPDMLTINENNIWYGTYGHYAENFGEYKSETTFEGNTVRAYTTTGFHATHTSSDNEVMNHVYDNMFTSGWDPSRQNEIMPLMAVYSDGTGVVGNTITNHYGPHNYDDALIKIEHTTSSDEPVVIVENKIMNCENVNGIRVRADEVVVGLNDIQIDNYYDLYTGIYLHNCGYNGKEAWVEMNNIEIYNGNPLWLYNSQNLRVFFNYLYVASDFYFSMFPANSMADNGYVYAAAACQSTNSEGYIATNMMVGENAYGLVLDRNFGIECYYNSVNTFSGEYMDGYYAPLYFGELMYDGTEKDKDNDNIAGISYGNTTLMRNLFINSGSGPAIEIYDMTTTLNSDYNDIWAAEGFDLASWQGMGYDPNSVSIPVAYQSMTDLHLTQFDEQITVDEPLGLSNEILENYFQEYDWDNEYRRVYYYGVDNLQPKVEIVDEPASVVDCENAQNHMLTCVAMVSLGARPLYQWQKNGVDIEGETTGILYLDDLTFEMSGVYRCVVSGTGGAEPVNSQEVLVYALTDPEITRQPESKTAGVGSTVMFEVQAHIAGDYPLEAIPTVQWHKGGNDLSDDDHIAGSQASIMSITNLQPAHYGDDYTVTLTGRCGQVTSDPFSISDVPTVDITTQPSASVSICEDEDLMLSVEAEVVNGSGLTYQWMFDDAALNDGGNISGANSGTLTITGVTAADAGTYKVVVTAQPGGEEETSTEAVVEVKMKPVITGQPEDVTIAEGDPFELVVEATGADNYQWQLEGADLPGETSATLTRASASMSDAGAYKCIVSNDCGDVESEEAMVTINFFGQISSNGDAVSGGYMLLKNTPNPFNGVTSIPFVTPEPAQVRIVITDNLGNEIAVIYDDENSGPNKVTVDAHKLNLPSGVYYYTMTAKGFTATRKLVLVK